MTSPVQRTNRLKVRFEGSRYTLVREYLTRHADYHADYYADYYRYADMKEQDLKACENIIHMNEC